MNGETDEVEPPDEPVPTKPIVIRSEELFHETQEIVIEHHGERYRLRMTRRGKLILQK